MAAQYWVGDFFVDLSRNQITQKEKSETIAPKALAVLTYLAKNQRRVVSVDELFSKVWPDTVVTPNTLQKSIAQLRKVLSEDRNLQSYIKTHVKQGYSLECDVRWQDTTELKSDTKLQSQFNPEQKLEAKLVTIIETEKGSPIPLSSKAIEASKINVKAETDAADKAKPSKSVLKQITAVSGIVVMAILGFNYLAPKQTSQLSFDKLRALTATDNKEYAAIYSPDGQYIVFHRYLEKLCMNNLWAKNMTTQQETRLTKDLGTYGSHSFSIDGKKLVFISTEDCDKPLTQKSCYNLMSLDFQKALDSPQLSKLMWDLSDCLF